MKTEDLDFVLPEELIAQEPTAERAASRLLHYRRARGGGSGEEVGNEGGEVMHRGFAELPGLLKKGDVLVFNDTRVIPARLALKKPTGGLTEGLFVKEWEIGRWQVMLKNVGGIRLGEVLSFTADERIGLKLLEKLGAGVWNVGVCKAGRESAGETAQEVLSRVGRMPLPPYIRRDKVADEHDELDRQRYQTVYAAKPTSVAAPTAGLHFTPGVFAELDERGIERVNVTLDVGMGTFKPVTADDLSQHDMHSETYEVTEESAQRLQKAKMEGRRIIAVGTTSARVLESMDAGTIRAGRGETRLLIQPGHVWKHVGGLITNFHLPKSTLIALVAGWVGLEGQRKIYREAIREKYRFFSYGDSSFLE